MHAVQFAKMHQEKGRSVLLTVQQEEWLTIQRMIADTNLQVGQDAVSSSSYATVMKQLVHYYVAPAHDQHSTCVRACTLQMQLSPPMADTAALNAVIHAPRIGDAMCCILIYPVLHPASG
jgi:hypothetical protein